MEIQEKLRYLGFDPFGRRRDQFFSPVGKKWSPRKDEETVLQFQEFKINERMLVLTVHRKSNASGCSISSWIIRISLPCYRSRRDTWYREPCSIYQRYRTLLNDCISAPTSLCRTILCQELEVDRRISNWNTKKNYRSDWQNYKYYY